MLSKLLGKNKGGADAQKDLEDLFSRPIKVMEIEAEPTAIQTETVEGIEQEGDEDLSAVQIKVDKSSYSSNVRRKETKELFSSEMLI